jgi:hypothetical protein
MKYLYFEDEQKLRKLLAEVCRNVVAWNGNTYAKYDQGWNDHRVAVATGIQIDTVKRIRAKVYGNIRIPQQPAPPARMVPIAAPAPTAHPPVVVGASNLAQQLVARVKRLEEQNDTLIKRLDQLEEVITRPPTPHGVHNGSALGHK